MLKKWASAQVLEAMEHPRTGLIRNAAKHAFEYEPRRGMIYARSRMISSRVNDNWDGFPAEEIEKGWRTFLGKPVFVNHHNDNHRRARGVIIDAVLHHHKNSDGSPDTWVEGLQEIDGETFQRLARQILLGNIDRTSMGVDVDHSICSACGNKATDTFSYCFPGSTPITMADGTLKPIEQIEVGDLVLSHEGSRRVTKLYRNHYNDDLVVIKRAGYGAPVKVTKGHPILANLVGRRIRGRKGSGAWGSVLNERNWDWQASEDVKKGSWVQTMRLPSFAPSSIDVASLDSRFSIDDDRAIYGAVYASGAQEGGTQYGKNTLPAFLRTDDLALAFIAGIYLAEGTLSDPIEGGGYKEVQWALGTDHETLIPRLQGALDALEAGQLRLYPTASGKVVSARLSNAPLAALLAHLCGRYGKHKRLAGDVMTAPESFRRAFLRSYQSGDSWTAPDGAEEIRTASPLLARQLVQMWMDLDDHAPSWFVNEKNPGGPSDRAKQTILHHVAMKAGGRLRGRRWLSKTHLAQQVTAVNYEPFHGTVYNFEVEEAHSYVAEGMIVHNCQHIPGQKGRKFFAAGGKGRYVFERCHGLRFFENSVLVEDPADPTAVFTERPVAGAGLEHLTAGLQRTARRERIHVTQREPVMTTFDLGPRFADLGLVAPRPIQREAARYNHPSEHPWFQANPVHSDHIVDHWNQATDDEKTQGKRWYPDAHLVAKSIARLAPTREGKHPDDHDARHPLGDAHLGASALAIYSPQQGWAGNMHNAARTLHEGKGIGGPGSGMFASKSQAASMDKVLAGGHMHDAVSGPKIRDFGHLIEHGGDEHPEGHPEHQSHVVIDRHALGVATGKRLSNEDYGSAPVAAASRRKDGTIPRSAGYDHVVNAYHEAGRRISAQEGEHVPGHAVQATTWLVRQRLNQEGEKSATGNDVRLNKGREISRGKAEQGWADFAKEHGVEHAGPGTGYTKESRRGGASFR